jgi:hypothetical protein
MRLRSSIASSSSNSVSSNTTASSGIAGIGYVGGKAVKWIGLQILNSMDMLVRRQRKYTIRRFIQKMGVISNHNRAVWIVREEKKINHIVEDLLELSM